MEPDAGAVHERIVSVLVSVYELVYTGIYFKTCTNSNEAHIA